jgi:hypothetical protein
MNEHGNLKQKRRRELVPSFPKNINVLEITGDYGLTCDKRKFLRYDNKKEGNRIIIFVCNEPINLLAESTEWSCDGTFKTSPYKIAKQVYTIHAVYQKATLACVYVLAECKTQQSYREIFNKLKDIALENRVR